MTVRTIVGKLTRDTARSSSSSAARSRGSVGETADAAPPTRPAPPSVSVCGAARRSLRLALVASLSLAAAACRGPVGEGAAVVDDATGAPSPPGAPLEQAGGSGAATPGEVGDASREPLRTGGVGVSAEPAPAPPSTDTVGQAATGADEGAVAEGAPAAEAGSEEVAAPDGPAAGPTSAACFVGPEGMGDGMVRVVDGMPVEGSGSRVRPDSGRRAVRFARIRARREEDLSEALLRIFLRRVEQPIVGCVEMLRDPPPRGRLTVGFGIADDGQLTDVTITANDGDPIVESCVTDALSQLRLPADEARGWTGPGSGTMNVVIE